MKFKDTFLKEEKEHETIIKHLMSKNATLKDVNTHIKSEIPEVRSAAVSSPKATEKHLYTAIQDKNPMVQIAGINHPSFDSSHAYYMHKQEYDKNPNVKKAIDNKLLNKK